MIRDWIQSSESWTTGGQSESSFTVIEATYDGEPVHPNREIQLSVYVYEDGVCVFCLEDYTETYEDYREYDPKETLQRRSEAHSALLEQTHAHSDSLSTLVAEFRDMIDDEDQRFSASRNWESGGLSYVFSFYFINVDINKIDEDILHDKLVFLLYAEEAQKGLEYAEDAAVDTSKIKQRYREQFNEILNDNYESLPHLHTCASWATVLVIGDTTSQVVSDYRELEVDLQHTWFYTYITGEFIEKSLSRVSQETSKTELDRLDSILTTMMNQVATYQGINQSMLTTRNLKLYNMLRDTSRLNEQITTVQKRADLARQRYDWLLNEKRTRVNKRVDFALFIIAIVTVVSEYQTFLNLGLLLIPVALTVVGISVYLFTPYLRGEI